MSRHDPIAYTYEADHHCPGCAFERYGRDEHGFVPETARDREGNAPGAVAPWDEWQQDSTVCDILACSDCHGEIDRSHAADCTENGGGYPCSLRHEPMR